MLEGRHGAVVLLFLADWNNAVALWVVVVYSSYGVRLAESCVALVLSLCIHLVVVCWNIAVSFCASSWYTHPLHFGRFNHWWLN